MENNNLFIDFKISKTGISKLIQKELDIALVEKVQVDGFELTLNHPKNETLTINAEGKSIFAGIPLQFSFLKPAGLFSVEGEGIIKINIELQCDIDEQMQLTTKTTLVSHAWIKDPVLQIGELNIPVETLSYCVISYMKGSLLDKLDQRVADEINIRKSLNGFITDYGVNYPIYKKPDLFLNSQLIQIQSDSFRDADKNIILQMWVDAWCKITDIPDQFQHKDEPKFYWIPENKSKKQQNIEVELSYAGISAMLINELNGKEVGGKTLELKKVQIRNPESLEIKAKMLDPIKGNMTITCTPSLDEDNQKILLDDISVDIDADNFIYKLSSPFIEKMIRNKIEGMFPFDPKTILRPFIDKIPEINLMNSLISLKPKVKDIHLVSLLFQPKSVVCVLRLEGAELEVMV